MIEGFILLAEMAAFGLVLWYARQLDGKRPSNSLGLFDMKPSDVVAPSTKSKRGGRGPHA